MSRVLNRRGTANLPLQLNRAYETLKEESSRRIYDIKWPHIAQIYRTAQEKAKKDAEAATAESEMAAKEKATRDAEDRKSRAIMEGLLKRKQHYESEVFEANRVITRLQSELNNIKAAEDKALLEERERNSWFAYAKSSLFGASKEPEEVRKERDVQHLHRVASKRIKEEDLSRREEKLKGWADMLFKVEREIATEISKRREREMQAEREREEVRRRRDAEAWKKRQDEFMEQLRARRAAAEAREAQQRAAEEQQRKEAEERRKRQAKEAEELRKKWAEEQRKREEEHQRRNKEAEERRNKEAEERRKREEKTESWRQRATETARASRQDGAGATPGRATRSTPTKPPNSSGAPRTSWGSSSTSCQHRGWWEKVEEGDLMCENCNSVQRRFLFQCPGCQMKACAECRIDLKPSRGRTKPWTNRRHGYAGSSATPRFGAVEDEGYGYSEAYTFDHDWYD